LLLTTKSILKNNRRHPVDAVAMLRQAQQPTACPDKKSSGPESQPQVKERMGEMRFANFCAVKSWSPKGFVID